MIKGLEHLICDERLRGLELFSLEMRRLRVNLINVYKCPMGGCKEDGARALLVVLSDRTTGSSLKLKYRKFHLDGGEKNPTKQTKTRKPNNKKTPTTGVGF